MAVRVKLRISKKNKEVILPALVKSGYETDVAELLVPVKVAENLSLWPRLRPATMEYYKVGGGEEIRLSRQNNAVKVTVITQDYKSKPIMCDLVISEGEDEVIISDKLASKLQIVIIDAGKGIWCFKKELGKKLRKSV